MSLTVDRRRDRLMWIKKQLAKIIEKEKQEGFKDEEFLAEIMCRFFVSKRIAREDLDAAKIYLKF